MNESLDTIQSEGDFRAVASLFKYGKGTYVKLILSICLILASAALLMTSAKLMGQLAEALFAKQTDTIIYSLAASIVAIEALNILIYYYGRVGIAEATNQVALQVRNALFEKLSRLPVAYFDTQPLGRTITRLTSDVEGIETFFNGTMPRMLTAFITIVSVFFAMILTDWKIGSIVALASLPAMLFTIFLLKLL